MNPRAVVLAIWWLSSCVGVRTPDLGPEHELQKLVSDRDKLVVLIDEDLPLYAQVITGIHVSSHGNYRVLRIHEEGFVQSALLEQLIAIKPRALIALGPRSANAIMSSRTILPSAFAMVPRIENYELDNVFVAGIRMVPDVKAQIALVRSLRPDLKALGVVFSRQSSRNSMQKVRSLCDDEQFELVNIEVQSVTDVLPALVRYHQEFGALLMIDDPLILDVEVIRAMISFLSARQIALFALDCSMVEEGALASFGTNFFTLGRDLFKLVASEKNVRLYQPTVFLDPSEADLCINLQTAKKMGDADQLLTRAIDYGAEKGIAIRAYR